MKIKKRFEYGYFYQLYFAEPRSWAGEGPDWTVSDFHPPPGYESKTDVDAKCAYAEVISYEYRDRHDCVVDRRHVSCQVSIPTLVDLFASPVAPFIPNLSDALISERLADQVRDSGLTNIEVRLVQLIDDPRIKDPPRIVALIYSGPEIRVMGWRGPESENKCPFCGFGPLWCRACEDRKFFCPECGRDCRPRMNELDAAYQDRSRLALGHIVDPRLWGGSDFLGGASGVITRRALDWLLSVHAAPFCARPLRADLTDLSPEQRRFLETAKEPVRN